MGALREQGIRGERGAVSLRRHGQSDSLFIPAHTPPLVPTRHEPLTLSPLPTARYPLLLFSPGIPAMPGVRRPSETFSLLCRTVAEVTAKNVTNGNNVPLLFLLRLIVSQRNLAFIHSEADTNLLATFINTTFQAAKLPHAKSVFAAVYGLAVEDLDIVARVKVRWAHRQEAAAVNFNGILLRACGVQLAST